MKTQRLNALNNWARTSPSKTNQSSRQDEEATDIVTRIMGQTAAPRYTTTPVSAGGISDALPEFGRWQDVQRLFGIKRGTLYNLLAEGVVKSVSIRRKGNVHGCRLFFLPGIRDYLNSLMESQIATTLRPSHDKNLDLGSQLASQSVTVSESKSTKADNQFYSAPAPLLNSNGANGKSAAVDQGQENGKQ